MIITINTSGLQGFRQKIQSMRDKSESLLDVSLEAGLMDLQKLAQDFVPVRTGNLKRNILRRIERDGSKVRAVCYVDLSGAPYAAEVEYGSIGLPEGVILPVEKKVLHWIDDTGEEHFSKAVFQPGKPYMRPAFEQGGHEAIAKAKEIYREGIKA